MMRISSLLLLVSLNCCLSGQILFEKNRLIMENEVMRQELSFEKGIIRPVSILSKNGNVELMADNGVRPWFEFVVNGQLVSSEQPVWKVVKSDVRRMNNGGTEIKITVSASGRMRGLRVEILRQIFPNSALIREKLLIGNSNGKNLRLTKLNNKLHFIFPGYNLKSELPVDSLTETRIASFDMEVVDDYNPDLTWDDRRASLNLAHCHMFHPEIRKQAVASGESFKLKGPFAVYSTHQYSWLMTYEHASQDKNYGSEFGNAWKRNMAAMGIDLQQGVEGASGIIEKEDDFWFLAVAGTKNKASTDIHVEILRGGYLDGEAFSAEKPYETVWAASAFILDDKEEKQIIHRYLWEQITENPASRKSHYYYNTWGMQRDNNNKTGLREIFTEARILEEIRYAAELNVDLIVLDDGWEEMLGVWRPHPVRLPNGLVPLIAEMKKHDIIPGIWLSPMGIDSMAGRYKQHPEWILRDHLGKPVRAQWGLPAFDFVSDFYNLFVADCKKLIDEGIRFFKWDAINTFNSTLPGLHHGSKAYSREEIRDRYGFMLPFYVIRAMEELREYNPDVVIEIDLTERERCIIGLMPLQEGKLFWMNNGGSAYNDFSTTRTKSMRTVINEYAGIIPVELFTQAIYPHQERPYDAQRYNVNTTLIGGRGFWGNLQMMTSEQRKKAGEMVLKNKLVLPYVSHLTLKVEGKIGDSPEIYSHINAASCAGQVIAFSGSALNYPYRVNACTDSCLAVLDHSYRIEEGSIHLPFQFTKPDDTREAFILPNKGTGFSVVSSTGWLDNVELNADARKMIIKTGTSAKMIIRLPEDCINVTAGGVKLAGLDKPVVTGYGFYEVRTESAGVVTVMWER